MRARVVKAHVVTHTQGNASKAETKGSSELLRAPQLEDPPSEE